jgi:uncharacterized membrane protein YeaQ/YmgE (transglycosylase-associated protein family)
MVGPSSWRADWLAVLLVGSLPGWLASWLPGRLSGWPAGWLAALLASRLVGWLTGWMADWLVGLGWAVLPSLAWPGFPGSGWLSPLSWLACLTQLAVCFSGRLAGWPRWPADRHGRLADLAGWQLWPAGRLAARLAGWLSGWLAGWMAV